MWIKLYGGIFLQAIKARLAVSQPSIYICQVLAKDISIVVVVVALVVEAYHQQLWKTDTCLRTSCCCCFCCLLKSRV